MENELVNTVLTEVLQELREMKQQQLNDAKAISDLKGKVERVEQKFSEGETVRIAKQTAKITSTIVNELDKVKAVTLAQPKSIRKEFRILLFPEYNAAEYYRIVFGRILFWLVMSIVATYLFVLGREFIQANAESRERLIEEFHYKKAWDYLYKTSNKGRKKEWIRH